MDMDSGMPNSTTTMTMMTMKPYIHFTPGDTLLFASWTPTSPGIVFGACFGLFMLAILKRLAAAIGRVAMSKWAETLVHADSRRKVPAPASPQAQQFRGDKEAAFSEESASVPSGCRTSGGTSPTSRHFDAPFIARIEVQRGFLRAGEALLGYVLMLAVMTFNAGFIFSIIIGLGLGEMLFGRFGT